MSQFTKIFSELLLTKVKTTVLSCKKIGGLLKHIWVTENRHKYPFFVWRTLKKKIKLQLKKKDLSNLFYFLEASRANLWQCCRVHPGVSRHCTEMSRWLNPLDAGSKAGFLSIGEEADMEKGTGQTCGWVPKGLHMSLTPATCIITSNCSGPLWSPAASGPVPMRSQGSIGFKWPLQGYIHLPPRSALVTGPILLQFPEYKWNTRQIS